MRHDLGAPATLPFRRRPEAILLVAVGVAAALVMIPVDYLVGVC
jgi:hypothetical protein